jgi:hypothetical protein
VRHSGGATVSPVVIRPDGEETSKAKVKDLTDGRYLLSFTPDQPGEYVVTALVNGEEIPADQELQATVVVPPLTVDMCELFVPDQARSVPAGSSFYVTVGPPESSASTPEDGTRCLVHLQDPDNAITLFPALWDQQQVAFVADVFLGMVGGNLMWATIDVRLRLWLQSCVIGASGRLMLADEITCSSLHCACSMHVLPVSRPDMHWRKEQTH